MELSIGSVTKRFGRTTVLDTVTLRIAPGEVVGFIGPNGAGKTTTMKIAAGLLKPDGGEVRIGDVRVARDPRRYLAHIGVLIDAPAFYPRLSAYGHVAYLCRMRGRFRAEQARAVLEAVGLDAASRKHAGQFSTGMKQRLGIAMALLHEPQFLILDEPTNGLDPVAIVEMRALIGRLARERGMGLLVSSHLLHEVEQVCDRVVFIRQGRIAGERRMGPETASAVLLLLRTTDNARAHALLEEAGVLSGIEASDSVLRCRCASASVAAIAPLLVRNDIGLLELRQERETLEQVYLSEYSGDTEALR